MKVPKDHWSSGIAHHKMTAVGRNFVWRVLRSNKLHEEINYVPSSTTVSWGVGLRLALTRSLTSFSTCCIHSWKTTLTVGITMQLRYLWYTVSETNCMSAKSIYFCIAVKDCPLQNRMISLNYNQYLPNEFTLLTIMK